VLRLSKLADYGTLVATDLAAEPRSVRNAHVIAERTRVAAPTVAKLLKRLARAGLVESIRGSRGGYRLARPAAEISVAAVIGALERPLALTQCAAHGGDCNLESHCAVRGHWRLINHAIRSALEAVNLAQMAAPLNHVALHEERGGMVLAPLAHLVPVRGEGKP
jgi:FeS assembly SUF system regulator